MGIDLRQSRADYPVRNIYYKSTYVDKMKLVKGAEAAGVFYSTDKEAFRTVSIALGSIKKRTTTGVIETMDSIPDLEVDDFVLNGGVLYRVQIIVADDTVENKQFSVRPTFLTWITLIR